MTVETFYAKIGDRFGVTGGDRVNPHRGVDFPWGEGTPIPTWCDGTIVRNEWNSVIGWIVTVNTSGGWAGFCHMATRSPLPVGTKVRYGDTIGTVGNTGSASRGAHLHATFSTTGDHPGTDTVIDPLPWIQSAIRGQTPTVTKGDTVKLMIVSGENYYTAVTEEDWFDLPSPMPKDVQAIALKLWGPNELWTSAERTALKSILPKRGSSVGGGTVDVVAIAKAVNDDAAARLKS